VKLDSIDPNLVEIIKTVQTCIGKIFYIHITYSFNDTTSTHAGSLIAVIDDDENTYKFELFEPHGTTSLYDMKKVNNFFRKNIKEAFKSSTSKFEFNEDDGDSCPIGPQSLSGDAYCAMWDLYYFFLKINNPEKTKHELLLYLTRDVGISLVNRIVTFINDLYHIYETKIQYMKDLPRISNGFIIRLVINKPTITSDSVTRLNNIFLKKKLRDRIVGMDKKILMKNLNRVIGIFSGLSNINNITPANLDKFLMLSNSDLMNNYNVITKLGRIFSKYSICLTFDDLYETIRTLKEHLSSDYLNQRKLAKINNECDIVFERFKILGSNITIEYSTDDTSVYVLLDKIRKMLVVSKEEAYRTEISAILQEMDKMKFDEMVKNLHNKLITDGYGSALVGGHIKYKFGMLI
jgi:hypothetical protein